MRYLTSEDPVELAVLRAVAEKAAELGEYRMRRLARHIRNEQVR